MLKVTKRNVIDDDTPKVGVNKQKFGKIVSGSCNAMVAMSSSKQISQNSQKSQSSKDSVKDKKVNKTVGVKRKIDFNVQKGNNNNAQ